MGAIDLENQGQRCLFAYEEALGYMFPLIVRDKDGILAASVFWISCSQFGSPWATLQKLYKQHGYHVTKNTYWKSSKIATTKEVFEHIRHLGQPFPATAADRKVRRWRDITKCYDSGTETKVPGLPCQRDSEMITCWLDGVDDEGVRLTVRTSGTEPKIKSEFRQV